MHFDALQWNFITYLTNKSFDEWYREYMFDTLNCAFDYIAERKGILVQRAHEAYWRIMIPKTLPDVYEWFKANNSLPYRELTKINTHMIWRHEHNMKTNVYELNRNQSIQFTNEMKEEMPYLKEL